MYLSQCKHVLLHHFYTKIRPKRRVRSPLNKFMLLWRLWLIPVRIKGSVMGPGVEQNEVLKWTIERGNKRSKYSNAMFSKCCGKIFFKIQLHEWHATLKFHVWFFTLFVSTSCSSGVVGVFQAMTQSWGDLNLKAIWWVTRETWRKDGYFLSFIFFFFSQLASSKKGMSFILLDLFIFLNIMFI